MKEHKKLVETRLSVVMDSRALSLDIEEAVGKLYADIWKIPDVMRRKEAMIRLIRIERAARKIGDEKKRTASALEAILADLTHDMKVVS